MTSHRKHHSPRVDFAKVAKERREVLERGNYGFDVLGFPPGRLPPYDLDAERRIVSNVLADARRLEPLRVRSRHFFSEGHRRLCEALERAAAAAPAGAPVELRAIVRELDKHKRRAQVDVYGVGALESLRRLLTGHRYETAPGLEALAVRVVELARDRWMLEGLRHAAAAIYVHGNRELAAVRLERWRRAVDKDGAELAAELRELREAWSS